MISTLIVVLVVIWVFVIGVAIAGYLVPPPWRYWIGVSSYPEDQGEPDRRPVTVYAWLSVVIVPLIVGVVGVGFTYARHQSDLEAQRKQAENALKVQSERAKDEALQAYLDQMSALMLEHDLRISEEDSPERDLARARTLTVVKRQGPESKGDTINFLYEADLIKGDQPKGDQPVVNLVAAHLEEVQLDAADLEDVNLYYTYPQKAKFCWADLHASDLQLSDLSEADLRIADLRSTDLRSTDLRSTDLSGADLRGADLRGAINITQEQIDAAMGDKKTQLAAHLKRPALWSAPIKEQIKRHPSIKCD